MLLGSGRIGHEINALGVVEALGASYEVRRIAPRYLYGRLAPWGPVDPLDLGVLQGPPPDLVIASGRMTVPYMRAWKRRTRRCSPSSCRTRAGAAPIST